MARRLALIWSGGVLLAVVASVLLPAFAYPHNLAVWTANLSGFSQEWWRLGPFGSLLLPAATICFALFHLLLGTISGTSRYHLRLSFPLLFATLGLIQLGGAGATGNIGFVLLKVGIFGWLAGGTIAWAAVLFDRLPLRVNIVALVLVVLYPVSAWFSWPMLFFLILVVVLYWGGESLLVTSAGEKRGVLPLVFWLIAILILVLLLLLERFQPQLHSLVRLLPHAMAALLLLAPTVASVAQSNRQEARLHRNLEREREAAQKRLEKEVRRLEAIKNETVRALEIELARFRNVSDGTAAEPSTSEAIEQIVPAEEAPVEILDPSFEESATLAGGEESTPVSAGDEPAIDSRHAEVDVDGPASETVPASPPIQADFGPAPGPEELNPILNELASTIETMRKAMRQLRTTLADIIGQVALEEARVSDPLESWDEALMDSELNLFKLRDLFGLAEETAREEPSEPPTT